MCDQEGFGYNYPPRSICDFPLCSVASLRFLRPDQYLTCSLSQGTFLQTFCRASQPSYAFIASGLIYEACCSAIYNIRYKLKNKYPKLESAEEISIAQPARGKTPSYLILFESYQPRENNSTTLEFYGNIHKASASRDTRNLDRGLFSVQLSRVMTGVGSIKEG